MPEAPGHNLAYEAMLRALMDSFIAMLKPEVREQARVAAVNRAIKLIESQPLEDLANEVGDIARRLASDDVRRIWMSTIRRDN